MTYNILNLFPVESLDRISRVLQYSYPEMSISGLFVVHWKHNCRLILTRVYFWVRACIPKSPENHARALFSEDVFNSENICNFFYSERTDFS